MRNLLRAFLGMVIRLEAARSSFESRKSRVELRTLAAASRIRDYFERFMSRAAG
jgi:hypothetical protein